MTKRVENISIAEPNLEQIKTYWETNEKLESIFALRQSGKAINNYDFEFIIQPRLATFTSLQGNLETDPKEQLRDLIRKSYFVEAFNLAGSIINHQIKDPDPYYTSTDILSIWVIRFAAMLRCLETNSDSFYQLAEAEAQNFTDCNKANLFYQFFPEKFGDKKGCMVPFSLRLLAKQIIIKCYHHQNKNFMVELSNLIQLRGKIEKLISNPPFDADHFRKIWSRRLEGVNKALASSYRLMDDPCHSISFLRNLDAVQPIDKVEILFEVIKIAANAGLAAVAQEVMEETKLHVKNHGLENCEKSQKMLRLGTVFIDSIQWLQRGSHLEKSYADLKEIENGTDWEMKNNLGVCNFHRLNILESVEQYESSLQSQILKTGVLSPQIIFPVQRNLFTLNEMYKK